MKYIIMIGDGMADRPLKELGGKTPLQKASTPHMDRMAREGIIGYVRTIPPGCHPGSDVANLSILGYDPTVYYTGRAPLEAASMGVVLGDNDVAYRCNFVTLNYNKQKPEVVMEDYSAGHISSPEASILIHEINNTFGSENIRFYPGVSYRHLMVWRNGVADVVCIPPHDIIGKDITAYLPQGRGEEVLRGLMRDSAGILQNHGLNKGRIENGKRPANAIWLWGQGRKPMLQKFRDKYALEGALVSAVDLTKGLGLYAGFEILNVPGVTGYIDTNYLGKAEHSLDALTRVDLVYIHVEAPDEAGHSGNYRDKIKAIEDFDALVVGTVLRGAKPFEEYRILIMPDHATPIEMRTHTDEPVPFVIFDSRQIRENRGAAFDESILKRDDLIAIEEGYQLMDYFLSSSLPGE